MMRLSSSRNQRSKGGFKLKLVLQICLLVAICTWLLYQVKHSHDKKRAFEDKISKFAKKATSKKPDLFDAGRKGLPFVKENDSMTTIEEDAFFDKHEEGKRVGEDTIDELDQDRADEENEQEEEFFSEEEKDGRGDEDGLFDNKEGEDSAQEAREENYKRDDASSAVAHDSLMENEDDSKAVAIGINNETLGFVAPIGINNETMGYVAPISNVSDVSLGGNVTVNGSRSTEVKIQNEPSLRENDVANYSALAIQSGYKLNDSVSVSNTQISQPGYFPVLDQNYNTNTSEGHVSVDHRGSSTNKNENETTIRSDLLIAPVIQSEVKDTNDKAAG